MRNPKLVANWIIGPLFAVLRERGLGIEQSPVSAQQLGKLIDLIEDGTISNHGAKIVFAEMVAIWDAKRRKEG